MSHTTDKQRVFAASYVRNAGDWKQAAKDAMYANPETGRSLLLNSGVLELILEESLKACAANIPVAYAGILHLAKYAKNEAVRLSACRDLLDRGGLKVASELNINVRSDERSDEEVMARIAELREKLEESETPTAIH